jgi:heat shock protein HslJ
MNIIYILHDVKYILHYERLILHERKRIKAQDGLSLHTSNMIENCFKMWEPNPFIGRYTLGIINKNKLTRYVKMKIFKTFTFLSLLVAAMAFSIFSGGEEALNLDGSQWVLIQIDGEPTLPESETNLVFEVDQIHGSAGCNNYFANYTLSEDGDIEFGPAGSTMMFCQDPEGVMDQELAFLQMLAEVSVVSMDGGKLIIEDETGASRLVFQPISVD